MEWHTVLVVALATPVVLLPVAFVGYLTVGGYSAMRGARRWKTAQCSIDSDCGPGLVCKDGICVPSDR